MRLPELHPDELLAREASSTLTPREWADLSAHLTRCPACALERAARREAASVRTPSDLDHAIAARVVGRILAGQDRELGAPKRRRAWGGRRLAYAALVLLLVSGTAMAGVALVVQIRQREQRENDRLESEGRRSLPTRLAPNPHRAAHAPAEAAEPEEVESAAPLAEPGPAAIEPTSPPIEIPAARPTVPVRSETGGGRSVAVGRHRSSPGSAPARAERPPGDAATLLGQAEEAESAGRVADASRLYSELRRWFPGTREEIVARALHGQLLLDRLGSPVRALAQFEGYLLAEPAGTLAEEARLGRARALERLGRASEERSAWRELLRAHPRSVHAAGARARLAVLDGP
jgi:hypothetical protein